MRLFREDAEEKELGEAEIEEMLNLLNAASWRPWCGGALGILSERIDPLLATPMPDTAALSGLKGMLLDWDTPWGKVWVGGVDRQVYELPARGDVLILDLGGDDVYRISEEGRRPGSYEYLADLGGNDRYEASSAFGFGSTFGGCSFLYDRLGNDVYEGPMLSFGAGLLGVGLCIDGAGTDVYRCATGGLGAALAGVGLLADAGGNDEYLGHSGVEGVGGPAGAAALVDFAGDDLYVAGNAFPDGIARQPRGYINFSQGFGFGLRPYCSGGIGVLVDGSGDDRYLSSYFAQGSSYWFGAGALCDRSGNDNYQTLRYSRERGFISDWGCCSMARVTTSIPLGASARVAGTISPLVFYGIAKAMTCTGAAGSMAAREMPMDSVCWSIAPETMSISLARWMPRSNRWRWDGAIGWRIVTWIRWGSFSI